MGQRDTFEVEEINNEPTVRMTVATVIANVCDGDVVKLREENARLLVLNRQLRESLGLTRQELARIKASAQGNDRRLSIAESMADELMKHMEGLSMVGPRPRHL